MKREPAGRARAGVGLLCAALYGACAAQPAAPESPAEAPPPQSPAASGFGAGLRTIEAKGQGLAFPLPDPAGWRLDQREKHSWVAVHRRSSSQLVVRAWHFEGIPRADDCEREARLWRRDLPQFTAAEVVAWRRKRRGAVGHRVAEDGRVELAPGGEGVELEAPGATG